MNLEHVDLRGLPLSVASALSALEETNAPVVTRCEFCPEVGVEIPVAVPFARQSVELLLRAGFIHSWRSNHGECYAYDSGCTCHYAP